MYKVSIIIVSYNTKELLFNCLQSIFSLQFIDNYEVIVVDNNSSDGTIKMVEELYPMTKLIKSNKNIGFGAANNLGCKIAKGEYLFFLNSDTVLYEDSIYKLLYFFKTYHNKLNIGAIGCLMVDNEGNINGYGSSFPNCRNESNKHFKKIKLLSKYFSDDVETYNTDQEYFKVDYVLGADMFINKNLFIELNGFDEKYFMYYEESDFQFRLSLRGYKQYIVTSTKILHLEDGTGKKMQNYSNKKRILVHKSRNLYLSKNDKENYMKYLIIDSIVTLLNIFNFRYSINDNILYIKEVFKSY